MALSACPHCRALFDSRSGVCSECGYDLRPRRIRDRGGLIDRFTSKTIEMNLILILVNVALYIASIALSGGTSAEKGLGNLTAPQVADLGGLTWWGVARDGEWWRLVCPIFLHFSLLHIAFNCLALRFVGRLVEQVYGPAKFLAMYLVAGIGGTLASLIWGWENTTTVAAGASGAVFGLLGMAGVYGYRTKNEAIKQTMIRWALFALIFGLAAGADNAAHLGGLATGALLALRVSTAERTRLSFGSVVAWDVAALAGTALLVASFVAAWA